MWELRRKVTEASRNTGSLLKNDQFWPHRGEIDRIGETGKESRTKSEGNGRRG